MRRIATLLSLALVAAAAVPAAARASSTPVVSVAPDSAPPFVVTTRDSVLVMPRYVADSVTVAQRAAIDSAAIEVTVPTTPMPSPALAAAVDTAEHASSLSRSHVTRARSAYRVRLMHRSRYSVGSAIHDRLRPRALVRS